MTAPLLATRDQLLTVVAQHRWDPIGFACACGWAPSPGSSSRPQRDGHLADALAGVVRDPATLADDEALAERVNFAAPRQLFSGTAPEEIRDVLTNLAAALSEDLNDEKAKA